MKFSFVLLLHLLTFYSIAQDSTQFKKNQVSFCISPAINNTINSSLDYDPILSTSLFLGYSRSLYKNKLWIDGNIGVFTFGTHLYYSNPTNTATNNGNNIILQDFIGYNFYIALEARARYVFIENKNIVWYTGLSAQYNFYNSSYLDNYQINSDATIDVTVGMRQSSETSLGTPKYGIFTGLGYKIKRWSIILEPEFKTAFVTSDFFGFTMPYSLQLNTKLGFSF